MYATKLHPPVCEADHSAEILPSPKREADPITVSVVMPCLNEARTVGVCVTKAVESLRIMGVRGEVIVADNGSTDGSQEVATAAGARVVPVSSRGYGAALQGGIAAACGHYIVMGDADDSYDFSRLEPFLERLDAGDDLVMGNRFRGEIRPGAMPWHHRYVGNPVLTGILNLLYRSGIGDAHCGLRAFRKDAYDRLGLVTPGMEFASEMVVKATLAGLRMSEVPIVLQPDGRDRPPHLRSFRDGWRHLRFLLLFCPLWLFLIPAGILLSMGLGLMACLSFGPQRVMGIGFDVHTMVLGALFTLVGYQTLWLGLLAKVLGVRHRVLPPDRATRAVVQLITVEHGLVAGGVLFVAGLGMNLWLVREWWGVSLGALDVPHTLRWALWGLTGMVLGVQTAYGSLYLGLLTLWTVEARNGDRTGPPPA